MSSATIPLGWGLVLFLVLISPAIYLLTRSGRSSRPNPWDTNRTGIKTVLISKAGTQESRLDVTYENGGTAQWAGPAEDALRKIEVVRQRNPGCKVFHTSYRLP